MHQYINTSHGAIAPAHLTFCDEGMRRMQLVSHLHERLIRDSGYHRTVNEMIRHFPARVQPEALVLRRGSKADAANALSAPRGGNRSGFRRVAVGETHHIGTLARTRLLWRRCGVNRVRNTAATA